MEPKQSPISSKKIEHLQQALHEGNFSALDSFWDQANIESTPLIEPIPGSDSEYAVTFLWRAPEIESVSIVSLLTNPTIYPLHRLLKTDLWYLTCKVRKDLRATYQFIEGKSPTGNEDPVSRFQRYRPDPLNPIRFDFFTKDEDPMGVKFSRSVLEMPSSDSQPWSKFSSEIPNGRVDSFEIDSKILGNTRRTWVYTPPNMDSDLDQDLNLLILFDGWAYANLIPTFTILDNLQAMGRIPPTVAILPDSLDTEIRMEEFIFHSPFNQFLRDELLLWVKAHYPVTADPAKTAVGGSSAGGLAAAFAAFEHPDAFGNVIAQSGAFGFSYPGEENPEWLCRQFAESEKLPVNFYLDAGVLEINSLRPLGNQPNLLTSSKSITKVLLEKGYSVTFRELPGGHDYISWESSLPEALQLIFGKQD